MSTTNDEKIILITPDNIGVGIPDNDLVAIGVNMVVPPILRPNAQYVLKKIREVAGGAPITPALIMQLSLQAMMFSANSGPTETGGIKKDVVMYALRKWVLETDNASLDLPSKTALFLFLQDDGPVAVSIDQLYFASRQAKELFTGMTKACLCGLKKSKPKPTPKDFNPDVDEDFD
jgi:hypothetical protein